LNPSLEAVRQQLDRRFRENEQNNREAWKRLVSGLALKTLDLPPAEIVDELSRLGKSFDQLHVAIDQVVERQRLSEKASKLEKLCSSAEAEGQAFVLEKEKIEAKIEKLAAQLRQLIAKSTSAELDVQDARAARRELIQSCDESIRQAIQEARNKVSELLARRNETTDPAELEAINSEIEQAKRRQAEAEAEALKPESIDF
jgi:hypothetical protein